MIKKIVMALVIFIVVAVIVGFFLPAKTSVERSIVINKSPALIFPWLNNLKKFSQWSPWADDDPNMKITFSGPESGVGARMEWTSEEVSVGNGSQEIIESQIDERVVTSLEFGSPAVTQGIWELKANGDSATQITWLLDVDHGFNLLSRYFGMFVVDSMVGSYYDKGLAKLKQTVE